MADRQLLVTELCEIAAARAATVDMHRDETDAPLSSQIEQLADKNDPVLAVGDGLLESHLTTSMHSMEQLLRLQAPGR